MLFWFTTRRYGDTSEVYLQIGKEGTYWPNEREDIENEEIWREKYETKKYDERRKKGTEKSLEKKENKNKK